MSTNNEKESKNNSSSSSSNNNRYMRSSCTTAEHNTPSKNYSSSTCGCEVCICGPNCQCTETLCRCEASSVLNSLGSSNSRDGSPARSLRGGSPPVASSSCCDVGGRGGRTKHPLQLQRSTTTTTETEIGVRGMTCSMCTRSVERALTDMVGVSNVVVSLPLHLAQVTFDPTLLTRDDLVGAIEGVGYDVVMEEEIVPSSLAAATMVNPNGATTPTTTTGISLVEISVSGMTCSMCTQAIQRALDATDGVLYASVNLSTNQARIEFDSTVVNIDQLKETIEDIGYEVVDAVVVDINVGADDDHTNSVNVGPSLVTPDRLDRLLQQQQEEVFKRKRAFLWSLVGTVPIVIITMILPHFPNLQITRLLLQTVTIGAGGSGTVHYTFVVEALILWAICTPIQFGCGWPFYKSSYYGLRQGLMGMDVLVALGTSASYGYAMRATLVGSMEYHFFETSAVLICFVLLGKWMQNLAVRRTSAALTELLQLQPKTAIKVIPVSTARCIDGTSLSWNPLNDPYSEEVVAATSILTGDLVKVLKGSSIPADGTVRFGEMTVDESAITGESIPVLKTNGSVVLGGTICVEVGQEAGACFVQVTGVGSSTALSQIVQLVQDAQGRQIPIQNLADTISSIFVPSVVILSVVTFMVWYGLVQSGGVPSSYLPKGESPATFSLLFGISCLVISCPCALGLATPTAVMVGTGVGAKQGVLMKGGETLELASKVDSIVFDKVSVIFDCRTIIHC
jgi:Cu+-exporting ATPase